MPTGILFFPLLIGWVWACVKLSYLFSPWIPRSVWWIIGSLGWMGFCTLVEVWGERKGYARREFHGDDWTGLP